MDEITIKHLDQIKVAAALSSELKKMEYRKKNCPSEINILDYTVIAALMKAAKRKPRKSGCGRYHICPTCNHFISEYEQAHGNIPIPCCKWCGQQLRWSDEHDAV